MRTSAAISSWRFALCAAVLALFSSACTRRHVTRVARFDAGHGNDAVLTRAPESAAYKVKYADASRDGLQTVGGTKRIVRRGAPLGFTVAADGAIVAVAGDEWFPLDKLPATARYCVWVAREERPTQFAREVGKAATTAAVASLVSAIVVGAISMEMLEAQLDDDDCDDGKKDNNGYWIEAAGHAIQEIVAPRRSSSDTTLKKGQQPR